MRIKELEEKIEELEKQLEESNEWGGEQEKRAYELSKTVEKLNDEVEEIKEIALLDVNNFKRVLEINGLMTKELDEFIDNYMRWSNG